MTRLAHPDMLKSRKRANSTNGSEDSHSGTVRGMVAPGCAGHAPEVTTPVSVTVAKVGAALAALR